MKIRRIWISRKLRSLGLEQRRISFEGQSFRTYVGGQGPALVLLHGFLDTSHVFRRVLRPLLKHYSLYLIDLPGHGGSPLPPMRSLWHLPDMAASVFRLIHQYWKLHTPQVLAHSMGGLVALHASEFAKKYHGIRLFSKIHMVAPGALLLSPEEREVLRRRFFPGSREEVRELFSHLFYRQVPELPNWALSGLLYEWSHTGFAYLAANTLERESEVFYKPGELKWVPGPVHLYWGEQDSITPPALGRKLQKAIPVSKIHFFADCGHGLLQEDPGSFLEVFLRNGN